MSDAKRTKCAYTADGKIELCEIHKAQLKIATDKGLCSDFWRRFLMDGSPSVDGWPYKDSIFCFFDGEPIPTLPYAVGRDEALARCIEGLKGITSDEQAVSAYSRAFTSRWGELSESLHGGSYMLHQRVAMEVHRFAMKAAGLTPEGEE